MEETRASYVETLGAHGISKTTYPYGPDFGSVKPHRPSEAYKPRETSSQDPLQFTGRRLTFPKPPTTREENTLRYPETYVPPPSVPELKRLHLTIKLLGAGLDGQSVNVVVKSTGTVAEVITTAVEKLRMGGTILPYSNLRVTGLFSESGRPLSAGYRLHSHGQVPFVKDGGTLVLKVLQ